MSRGWSIVRDANGRSIKSVTQLHVADEVMVHLADGSVRVGVHEIRPDNDTKGTR
jgi:exonuclease VII large subunit